MAPGTRRANRAGYAEHDDFEGLPVRQWREEWINVAPPPPPETIKQNDVWGIELFRGMPKDSQLLPPHSQELLRAARSGRLYKRPAPTEEEDADADGALPEKPEKKDEDPSTKGFLVRQWKPVARNAEGPDISHLSKRRKNTVTIASKTVINTPSGNTVTKATVRRVDAAGNPYTQEVTLVEGQQVEGEIISTTVVAAPVVNADAGSAQATPMRRRPPPPKRKAKGPGRGRKKKFPIPASTRPTTEQAPGDATDLANKPGGTDQSGVKQEDKERSSSKDVEMADTSVAPSDDDDEGDDGDEGEEGDEGDNDDNDHGSRTTDTGGDQEMTDVSAAVASESTPVVKEIAPASEQESLSAKRQGPPMNPLSLAPPSAALLASGSPRGSPLKNVMVLSPTDPSPRRGTGFHLPSSTLGAEREDVVMTDQAPAPAADESDVKKEASPEKKTEDVAQPASPVKDPSPEAKDVEKKAEEPTSEPTLPSRPDTSQEAANPEAPAQPQAVSSLPSLRPDAPHPPAPPATEPLPSPEKKASTPPKPTPTPPTIQEPAPPAEPSKETAEEKTAEDAPPVVEEGPDLLGSLVAKLDREEEQMKSLSPQPPPSAAAAAEDSVKEKESAETASAPATETPALEVPKEKSPSAGEAPATGEEKSEESKAEGGDAPAA